ncbi:MAG: ABC transporter ATP-binding protein [Candidatus Aminicenantes bacterium]|nr:MAG: ABC transporter ATP-binding protein [Candidatus Aminicenantes bacterium]
MMVFEDVTFCYEPGRPVVQNASFALEPGLTLLLGPNGCGKSTLLKLAAGVERPDQGRILIDGVDLWREEVEARRRLAYLPEFPDITPYATLRDVLRLVCRLRGETMQAGAKALEIFGLAEEAGRSVRELSSGQRKRALFAAAFVGRPDHILLDEPLDAMDRQIADDVVRWIGERTAAGSTMVAVCHALEPLAGLATRAATVREGSVGVSQDLPAAPEARLRLLDALARGKAN